MAARYLYCEMTKSGVDKFGEEYIVVDTSQNDIYHNIRIPTLAHRVWEEDENGNIELVLDGQEVYKLDLKEFMLIKLKCKRVG